jgi:hypothetical protein
LQKDKKKRKRKTKVLIDLSDHEIVASEFSEPFKICLIFNPLPYLRESIN